MPVQPAESVTVTTIGNVPVCVGVPERTPAVESESPAGSVLAVLNVAVPNAPVCVNVWLNAAPAVPVFVAGLVTMIVGQEMTSVYVEPVPVHPFESVAVTTIPNEPVSDGVPDNVPFVASVKPPGSVDDVANVVVPCPPDCVNVWLNAVPAVPVVVAGFVTVIVGQVIVSVYAGLTPVQPLPSVTVTTIGNVPPCVGVPERVPLVASDRPVGSVDEVVNVAPPTAPLCVKSMLRAVPAGELVVDGLFTTIA